MQKSWLSNRHLAHEGGLNDTSQCRLVSLVLVFLIASKISLPGMEPFTYQPALLELARKERCKSREKNRILIEAGEQYNKIYSFKSSLFLSAGLLMERLRIVGGDTLLRHIYRNFPITGKTTLERKNIWPVSVQYSKTRVRVLTCFCKEYC